MKKMLLLFVFVGLLSACGGSDTDDLNDIKTQLEGIGYVFEQRDDDARTYYNNKAVNEEYAIDVTLTDLYIGYINETEGWLELLEFESASDCAEFIENTTESGYNIYHQGDTAFITFNTDATALFIDTGDGSKD